MAFSVRKMSNAHSAGRWIKELQDEQMSAVGGLTAAAGSTQATGVPLTSALSKFTTVGTAGDSATLPVAKAGMRRVVKNGAAANSMDIFPAVGESINALSGDAAYALAVTKTVEFFCFVDGKWDTVLTA